MVVVCSESVNSEYIFLVAYYIYTNGRNSVCWCRWCNYIANKEYIKDKSLHTLISYVLLILHIHHFVGGMCKIYTTLQITNIYTSVNCSKHQNKVVVFVAVYNSSLPRLRSLHIRDVYLQ